MPRNDLELYERAADAWWDGERKEFRSLRAVNAFHLGLLCEHRPEGFGGQRVADLGCGGGLLSIALSRLGADVVGVDLSPASLRAGRDEARRQELACTFLHGDLNATPLRDASFDLVLASDVLEHVSEPACAVREAGRLLRAGGTLFVNTFDRGLLSALVVVFLAEGLGFVPRGTHDPRLFVRPRDLETWARAAALRLEALVRERPLLLASWRQRAIQLRPSRWGFGYSAFFRKEAA